MRRPGDTPGAAAPVGIAAGLIALAFAGVIAAAAAREPDVDSQSALQRGNRLFRDGRLEAAVAAYLEGHSPAAPHPTLAYNLGTALHHLDRLPEAILWYRRAAGSDDPWLEDNLWLARRILGSRMLPAGDPLGWLAGRTDSLRLAGIALAWLSLLVIVAWRRTPGWTIAAAALLAGSLYFGAAMIERWGPRPAVVLEDCLTPVAELPAGTEVWVRPDAAGDWRISGSDGVVCPPGSVELVVP